MFITSSNILFSQHIYSDTLPQFKKITAGEEYNASSWHKWLWGSNYRNVWTTPVSVKVINLDTAKGGLKPFAAYSFNQSKNLRLRNANNEEYFLRPVNKTPGNFLPEIYRRTFIEYRVNDEMSMSNPYAASTIPYLAASANIPHNNPEYVYVPHQTALGEYNNNYGNNFYLFEKDIRDSLSNKKITENYIETSQLLDSLKYNSNVTIDQQAFIRDRLFDMFINDWHSDEAQWTWLEKNAGGKKIYVPVPIDHDQAYSKHNGVLLNIGLGASGLNYRQSFDKNLKNVNAFNYEAKGLDRRLLNKATLNDWQSAALDLQHALTDSTIEIAIKQLPKEIYPLVGKDITEKLKARRNHIVEWATEYYNFISKEVEIPGSYQDEEFDIERLNKNETSVQAFILNNQNEKSDTAFYSRTFKSPETKEIRLFGIAGKNKYVIKGDAHNNIKVKIIAGLNQDSVIDVSSLNKKNNYIIVYAKNNIKTNSLSHLHVVNDTTFRSYSYNSFNYDRKGFLPTIFYSTADRLYVSLGYRIKHYAWGKNPYASNQFIDFHYSLMELAPSLTYKALFPNLIAHADFTIFANFDDVRWSYFFGIGNETQFNKEHKLKYYTMRTRQWIVQPGITKTFGKSIINVFAITNALKIINDTARFLNKDYHPAKSLIRLENFCRRWHKLQLSIFKRCNCAN